MCKVNNNNRMYKEIVDQAVLYRDIGQYNEAIAILAQEESTLTNNPDLLALVSQCYLLSGDIVSAEYYLTTAEKLDADSKTVSLNKIRLLLKKACRIEALALAQVLAQRYPHDTEVLAILGTTLRVNKSFERALDVLSRVILLRPNYAEALINRGLIWMEKGLNTEAFADLHKAHIIKPHIKEIWDLIINLASKAEMYSEAISVVTKIIAMDPSNQKYFSLFAALVQKADDVELSITSYKKYFTSSARKCIFFN